MAPRLRPLLTQPNDGTQKENRLDLRVALKTGAGQFYRSDNGVWLTDAVPAECQGFGLT